MLSSISPAPSIFVSPVSLQLQFKNLVFIDAAVDDYPSLMAGVLPGYDVILLHPEIDGIAQISEVLSNQVDIATLHIVSHGHAGRLQLGNTWLSLETLVPYQNQLLQWRDRLADGAEIFLYGCQVAEGIQGEAFIRQLHALTGAKIAASTSKTGDAHYEGNWQLERTIGSIQTPLAFQPTVMASYPSVLTTLLFEDFSDAIGSTPPPGWSIDVIAGDPSIDAWVFDNPAGRDVADLLTDPFAIYDSDFFSNDDIAENVAFVSPEFDISGVDELYLKFDQEYQGLIDPDYGSLAYVEVLNGDTWETVYFSDSGEPVIGPQVVDLTDTLAGVSSTQIRFRFEGNWSYYWGIDNVEVTDELLPGIKVIGSPAVSEDNVPDPLRFSLVLEKAPTADVTLNFTVDENQLQPLASITFTPDNWNIPQTVPVEAVTDDIYEGNDQKSPIEITVTSADPQYASLRVPDAIATITEDVIPNFPSYRTVEGTYEDLEAIAAANPDLASWVDIGDSYDKTTPGGSSGYNIYALQLTNKDIAAPNGGKKPVLYLQASIHAREYTTTEAVTRFAEQLVAGYGVDADSTWLLDNFQVHVVPIVNPDGRKFAEQGYLWRKNTNPGDGTAFFPYYGVDLNRNYSSKWGEIPGGSSDNPFSDLYRGTAPFSEPETQAVRDYLLDLFPDQKGPDEFDPAPDDATGVYIDVHSYSNLILYPFGWTNEPPPNYTGLRNLGLKFGYYTALADGEAYDVQQGIGLYPTDGTSDDWAYNTFGVASYTFELGTTFFQDTDYFETIIDPEIIPAFFYAAKSAYRPYQTSAGPDIVNPALDFGAVAAGFAVTLTATADSTRYDDDNGNSPPGLTEGLELPEFKNIAAARYSIDAPSWFEGTTTAELDAADGAFDGTVEDLIATIDTSELSVGRHTIYLETQNEDGVWGVPTAIFLDILDIPTDAETLTGTGGADELKGGKRTDVIYALAGDDTAAGGGGDDYLFGGTGDDTLRGDNNSVSSGGSYKAGDDVIYGGAGADRIGGKGGDDALYGDEGNDSLWGDEGDDLLWGGAGDDYLRGGSGSDTFALAFGQGTDTIFDFRVGRDLIGLAGRLSFDQLDITQTDGNVLIGFQTETLAVLQDVTATLTAADFAPIA